MPFLLMILYYLIIVPSYTIGDLVESRFGNKVGTEIKWIVVHLIVHLIIFMLFIALPLWLFGVKILIIAIIFLVLEVICFYLIHKHNSKK